MGRSRKAFGRMAALLCVLALAARVAAGQAGEYVLGPDDVVEISVPNHPDLGSRETTVRPDGRISFPEAGELLASGKTARQLGAEIQAALEKTRNRAEVVVTVKASNWRKARAVGAVRSPGSYALRPNWRLTDLIGAAGGLADRPNRMTANLIRHSTRLIRLDLQGALSRPDSDANPLLEPEDLVVFEQVDPARRQVNVAGQVAKPGPCELQDGTTLISVISQAGLPTEKAALSKAYVLRGATRIPVDLRRLLVKGEADPKVTGFVLEPGDTLFVPEIEDRFAVMGQVRSPNYYPMPDDEELTVLRALSIAGGQSADADLIRAGVIRIVDGKTTLIPVNIDAMLKKRNLSANLALWPNDILYIPTRSRKGVTLTDIAAPFSILYYLGFRR